MLFCLRTKAYEEALPKLVKREPITNLVSTMIECICFEVVRPKAVRL